MGNKKFFSLPFTVFCIFVALLVFVYFNQPNPIKTKVIIENNPLSEIESKPVFELIARNKNNITVAEVLSQEEQYRMAMKLDIDNLKNNIANFCLTNQYFCLNFESKKIIKQMIKDKDILLKIAVLSLQESYKTQDIIFYRNKMPEAIDYAMNIVSNRANLQAIFAGKMPENLNISWNDPTILGGVLKKDIKGTNEMLGFIVTLFYIAHNFHLDFNNYSSISFSTLISDVLKESDIYKEIKKYTFFKDNKMMLAYAGQEYVSYIEKKKFYPKDSAVWLGEVLKIDDNISTLNLMSFFNDIKNSGFVIWNKDSIRIKNKLKNKIYPLSVNTIRDIPLGAIIAERYFNSVDEIGYTEGAFGKIGIVVGVNYENGEIFGLSYGDDVSQNKNGFGIEFYKFNNNPNVIQMFFKINDA